MNVERMSVSNAAHSFFQTCSQYSTHGYSISSGCPVDRDDLSEVLTSDFVVGFPVHLVEMLIPPLIPALIVAELPRLGLRFPINLQSTVLARGNDGRYMLDNLFAMFN